MIKKTNIDSINCLGAYAIICSLVLCKAKIFEYLYNKIGDNDILCFTHPDRTTILDESIEIGRNQLETSENIQKIKRKWKEHKFSDTIGLTETDILLRKHKNIMDFSKMWTQYITICRRDQLSFDCLLQAFNIRYLRLPHKTKLTYFKKNPHANPHNRTIVTQQPQKKHTEESNNSYFIQQMQNLIKMIVYHLSHYTSQINNYPRLKENLQTKTQLDPDLIDKIYKNIK